jgi:hypothetical protein
MASRPFAPQRIGRDTEHDPLVALTESLRDMIDQLGEVVELAKRTSTVDSIVDYGQTVEADATSTIALVNLVPQTAQLELIEGFTVNLLLPSGSSVTVQNAYVTLGSRYYGVQGILTAPYAPSYVPIRQLLSANDTRSLVVMLSANFPVGTYVTFALFGRAIPTTLGGVLR